MSRRRTVQEWRELVLRTPSIGDPTRVLLLYLVDFMKYDRSVSVPREQIALALGKSERRISERISAAHDAGLLGTKSPGYRGHTAVYEGQFGKRESGTSGSPLSDETDRESGTHTSPLSSAETRPLSTGESGTPGGPTISRADLTATTTDRNGALEGSGSRSPLFLQGHAWVAQDCPHGIPDTCPECPTSTTDRANASRRLA